MTGIDFSNLSERLKERFFKNTIFADFVFNDFFQILRFSQKQRKAHFFNFEKIGGFRGERPLTKMYFWRTKFAKSTIEYCTCYSNIKTGDGIRR